MRNSRLTLSQSDENVVYSNALSNPGKSFAGWPFRDVQKTELGSTENDPDLQPRITSTPPFHLSTSPPFSKPLDPATQPKHHFLANGQSGKAALRTDGFRLHRGEFHNAVFGELPADEFAGQAAFAEN